MAPKLKVTYFDMKGRAEPTRVALTIGGIPFEDERVTREAFMAMKPSLPFGSLPSLEVDGKVFAQSNAMLRYVGKLTGLYPTDPVEALKVDQILDGFEDNGATIRPSYMEKDEAKKLEMRKALTAPDGGLTRYTSALSRLVEGEAHAVGDSLTIADVAIYCNINLLKSGYLDGIPRDWVDQYEPLMRVYNTVKAHPAVVAWEEAHK
eukprot:jgi/Mesvir1/3197/Mv16350-RA.1